MPPNIPEACDVPIELRMRANVFVKGLPPSMDSEGLHTSFSSFGQILSAKVVKNEEGGSLGYGYIQFASADGACKAIAAPPEGLSARRFVPKNERDKRRVGFTNIYVRNFPKSVATEDDLRALFDEFGEISSVFLAKGEDGGLKGFGFVNFASHVAAEQAVRSMNEKKLGNRKIYVAAAQTKEERARILAGWVSEQDQPKGQPPLAGETIIVKNLPYCTSGTDLRKLFQSFGKIYLTKIAVTHDGKSRGFGFIHFETVDAATTAVQQMHMTMIGSRRVSVSLTARKLLADVSLKQMGSMSPVSPMSGAMALASPRPQMLPRYQYYPAYQYPISAQDTHSQGQLPGGYVSSPAGYLSSYSSDDMGSSPVAQSLLVPEERCSMFQHGTGGSWNQPYYWPLATGAGHFSNVVGHTLSNPYAMMAPGVHVMQGGMAHAGGH